MPGKLRSILALLLPLLIAQGAVAQPTEDAGLACDRAAAQAEHTWNLPPGLLAAIGTVESGRIDPVALNRHAWPWSINADGAGYFAASKSEAIGLVRMLQARGSRDRKSTRLNSSHSQI